MLCLQHCFVDVFFLACLHFIGLLRSQSFVIVQWWTCGDLNCASLFVGTSVCSFFSGFLWLAVLLHGIFRIHVFVVYSCGVWRFSNSHAHVCMQCAGVGCPQSDVQRDFAVFLRHRSFSCVFHCVTGPIHAIP